MDCFYFYVINADVWKSLLGIEELSFGSKWLKLEQKDSTVHIKYISIIQFVNGKTTTIISSSMSNTEATASISWGTLISREQFQCTMAPSHDYYGKGNWYFFYQVKMWFLLLKCYWADHCFPNLACMHIFVLKQYICLLLFLLQPLVLSVIYCKVLMVEK